MLDSDLWADADMESVVTYLRGGRNLNVPPAIRQVLAMDKWIQMFFLQLFNKKPKKDLSELSKAGFAIALYSHALIKCLPIVLTVQSLSHKCLVYWTLYSNTWHDLTVIWQLRHLAFCDKLLRGVNAFKIGLVQVCRCCSVSCCSVSCIQVCSNTCTTWL